MIELDFVVGVSFGFVSISWVIISMAVIADPPDITESAACGRCLNVPSHSTPVCQAGEEMHSVFPVHSGWQRLRD
jgi:hypothetical protein